MLTFRLCVSAILAGKKPAALPPTALQDHAVVAVLAPPPLKKEAAPSERDGVVWSPGYWKLSDRWFVWCAGHWELSRPGQHYLAPRWERYADGWHFQSGSWHDDVTASIAEKKRRSVEAEDPAYDALGAFR